MIHYTYKSFNAQGYAAWIWPTSTQTSAELLSSLQFVQPVPYYSYALRYDRLIIYNNVISYSPKNAKHIQNMTHVIYLNTHIIVFYCFILRRFRLKNGTICGMLTLKIPAVFLTGSWGKHHNLNHIYYSFKTNSSITPAQIHELHVWSGGRLYRWYHWCPRICHCLL